MKRRTGIFLAGLMIVTGLLGMLASPLSAGRGRFELRAARKGWDYPKLTGFTYIEDSKAYGRLTLCASGELAMHHLKDKYLPVLFVLASETNPSIGLDPKFFDLMLPDGTRVKPVTYQELVADGWKSELIHDWNRLRNINTDHGWFSTGYQRVHSDFYPNPVGSGIVLTNLEVTRDHYAEDMLYFPNPGDLGGKELRLRYADPDSLGDEDLVREIEVVFMIPDRGKKEDRPQTRSNR